MEIWKKNALRYDYTALAGNLRNVADSVSRIFGPADLGRAAILNAVASSVDEWRKELGETDPDA